MKVYGTLTLSFEKLVENNDALRKLIESFNNGTIDPDKIVIGLKDDNGNIKKTELKVNNADVEYEDTDEEE